MKKNLTIDNFEDYILELIKEEYEESKFLSPVIFILLKNTKHEGNVLSIIPVVDELLNNKNENVLIDIFKRLKKEFETNYLIPVCFSFCSEMQLREVDKGEIPKDWKKLDAVDVISAIFSKENTEVSYLYDIKKDGLEVNNKGKLQDSIKLELRKKFESDYNTTYSNGKFSNLYKKYQNA